MRRVTYSMGVSLDGYIAGPDGEITAPPPDEEVFRFVLDEIRQVGVHLLGRKLYETMLFWETDDHDPPLDDTELVETRTFSSRAVYLRHRVARENLAARDFE